MNFLRILPPLAVLGVAGAFCAYLFWSEPEPPKWPQGETVPEVEAMVVREQDYQVWLNSQGTVLARTESDLIAEVRGKIISVSPSFNAGGFFEKGDLLLQIDPRDYEAAVTVAEAGLAEARYRLSEEEASADQARVNWQRLNPGVEPPELVAREPQLLQARANVAAAEAQLANAKLNLERTRITAPYAGRVLSKEVDVGQYVGAGTTLARIYAVDYVEIRLPLSERQLGFIDVPEMYRGGEVLEEDKPLVRLSVTLGNDEYEWKGRVVRAEGALDTTSRQLFVVAQVDNPYGLRADGRPPLKIGSFVQARIEGELLEDVFVIDRKLHRKNEYVVTIDDDSRIRRREIEVLWSDPDRLVIREGLEAGELICLTHLNFPADGMEVKVVTLDGKPVPQEGEPEPPYRRRGPQADS